jgi:hypothetical protein
MSASVFDANVNLGATAGGESSELGSGRLYRGNLDDGSVLVGDVLELIPGTGGPATVPPIPAGDDEPRRALRGYRRWALALDAAAAALTATAAVVARCPDGSLGM